MVKQAVCGYKIAAMKTDMPNVVAISEQAMQLNGIDNSSSLSVMFGRRRVAVEISSIRSKNKQSRQTLFFSKYLLSVLGLHEGMLLGVRFDKHSKTIYLGPIVGLFAIRDRYSEQRYGKITHILQELILAGRQRGALVYVFSPKDVNFEKEIVFGTVFNSRSKKWKRYKFPLPNVVYDRISSRRVERLKSVQQTKRLLRQLPGLHYFNPHFLSKWEVHELLSKNSRTAAYLPETRILRSAINAVTMLNKSGQVYLKPIQSSLGLGICWIGRYNAGVYRGQHIDWDGREIRWIAYNADDLARKIRHIVRGRRYVVQQGLKLATLHGRPCDIRLLMQKNSGGEWRLTTSIGRVALAGSKISNFAHGGSLMPVLELLQKTTRTSRELCKEQKRKLIEMGTGICQTLEEEMGADLGELGLDIALDKNRKLWLIEVNAKPGRDVGIETHEPPRVARRSVRNIMDYCRYISGFNGGDNSD